MSRPDEVVAGPSEAARVSPVRSDSSKAIVALNPLLFAGERVGADPDDLTGLVLVERYKLLRILGTGGMGYVYLARHVAIEKFLVVKVLGLRWAKQEEFRARFVREAKACSLVAHENVVEVHDFGQTPNGSAFLAMELLQGEQLGDLLAREGPLPWPRAKGIILQVCRALHAAHDRGVLHRDVKPDNCFRIKRGANRDFIKMLDFGIAKIVGNELDPHSSLTQAGSIFGTAEYMSPEQARGKPVDARTDVYSTGILLYEIITGQVPFLGANALDVLTKVVAEAPAPPRVAAPQMAIPTELEDAVLRAIEKEPHDRFQSMRELAEALASIPTSATPAQNTTPERRDRESAMASSQADRRVLMAAVMVLAAVVLLLVIALVALLLSR